MKQSNINDFKGGWFVGDFEPSIFKNPFFEVAHHSHKKGCETFPHYHKVTQELNYILRGEVKVSGKHFKSGDMWIYEPNDVSDVEFLADTDLVIVRWPSIPSDKYMV
jgi:quercetin dioxygenase-like cupin family protein|tara:strand:+ start:423 stop:743 length:321 start_codon:yes stop_codon:yes gene_type:complete